MTKMKIILLMILIVTLIGISAVSAAENATDDIITTDANEDTTLREAEYETILNETDDNDIGADEDPIPDTDKNRFGDLYDVINRNTDSEIHLDRDYYYDYHTYVIKIEHTHFDDLPWYSYETKEHWDPYKDGIPINRDVTIYGDGHTIDGKNLARIFKINKGQVTLVNIKFINAEDSAIYGNIYTAKNCTFINNHASNGGAMYMGTAENCTFTGNTATNGGALYGSTAINCTFTANKANNGGAISNGRAIGSNFTRNTADNGGAFYESNAERCTFIANNADNGGAVYGGIIADCNFRGNEAKNGGAINNADIESCTFSVNKADNGGAIYNSEAKDCNFTGNEADNGGAAYSSVVKNSRFENNWGHDGGAISYSNASECEFINNTANSDGGAADRSNVDKCNFTSNRASNDGGAVSLTNARNCLFTNNSAEYGGAMDGGAAESCTFIENTAVQIYQMGIAHGGDGGAISKGNAIDCKFIKNTADGLGGAIYKGNVKNSIFKENEAESGGALEGGDAENCNFTQNKATFYGGAIRYGDALNCIFINNAAPGGGALSEGEAIGSIFIENKATKGGAIFDGSATNCTFTDNEENGAFGSINPGKALLCIFNEGQFNPENITVIPANFMVSNMTAGYGAGHKLLFDLTANDKKYDGFNTTIRVYENGIYKGTYYALSGADGGWTVNLEPGTYHVVLSMDNRQGVNNATAVVNVITTTSITADDLQTTYSTDDYLIATLSYGDGKTVGGEAIFVDMGSTEVYIADTNGQVKIPTKGMAAGIYSALITFEGDEDYMGSSTTATITINKEQSKITAIDAKTTYDINKNLVIILTDSRGNALNGFDITVDLNGAKTYTTDKNGQITINVAKLVPKTYSAKITFNGNTNYLKAEKSVKVTVKKATPKLNAKKKTFKKTQKVKKYTITLKSDKSPIKKAKVTIKIGKKTYKATTNAKGKATFKIKKLTKKGNYKAVIKYKGDKYYNKATKKVKITIK